MDPFYIDEITHGIFTSSLGLLAGPVSNDASLKVTVVAENAASGLELASTLSESAGWKLTSSFISGFVFSKCAADADELHDTLNDAFGALTASNIGALRFNRWLPVDLPTPVLLILAKALGLASFDRQSTQDEMLEAIDRIFFN